MDQITVIDEIITEFDRDFNTGANTDTCIDGDPSLHNTNTDDTKLQVIRGRIEQQASKFRAMQPESHLHSRMLRHFLKLNDMAQCEALANKIDGILPNLHVSATSVFFFIQQIGENDDMSQLKDAVMVLLIMFVTPKKLWSQTLINAIPTASTTFEFGSKAADIAVRATMATVRGASTVASSTLTTAAAMSAWGADHPNAATLLATYLGRSCGGPIARAGVRFIAGDGFVSSTFSTLSSMLGL